MVGASGEIRGGKAPLKTDALQTLREYRSVYNSAPAFGVRVLQHRSLGGCRRFSDVRDLPDDIPVRADQSDQ